MSCARALLEAKADVHHTNDHGSSVPMCTIEASSPMVTMAQYAEVLQMLLEAMANPDRSNVFGRAPLHQAAADHKDLCVEVLLKGGAKPDVQDTAGVQPLYLARVGSAIVETVNLEKDESKKSKKSGKGSTKEHSQQRTIELLEEALAAQDHEGEEDEDDSKRRRRKKFDSNASSGGGSKEENQEEDVATPSEQGSSLDEEVAIPMPRHQSKITAYNPATNLELAVERAKQKNAELEAKEQNEAAAASGKQDQKGANKKASKQDQTKKTGKSTKKKKKA